MTLWWCGPSAQQGSVAYHTDGVPEPESERERERDACVRERETPTHTTKRPRAREPSWLTLWWSLAPMNSLRDTVPPVPGPRTASPQPVSSARRRLSTDEMQLREVGKLAVYLWKIRWLQRPSRRAPPWTVWLAVSGPPLCGGLTACHAGTRVQPPPTRPSVVGDPQAPVPVGLPLCLPSGSRGTVAVQGNLTV